MTDRERLIDRIIKTPQKEYPVVGGRLQGKTYRTAEMIADYILEDGWVRLPCKVGDTVWAIALTGKLYEYTVNGIHQFEDKHFMFGAYRIREDGKKVNPTWQDSEIGKIVFIGDNAKYEAEKALAEREGKDGK